MPAYLGRFATVVLATLAAAAQSQHHAFMGALADDCQFSLGDREYNLCPAFMQGNEPVLANGNTYIFSLSNLVAETDDRRLRGPSSWIRLIGDHPPLIFLSGNWRKINDVSYSTIEVEQTHGSLVQKFLGPDLDQTAEISWVCSPNSRTASRPLSLGVSDSGVHRFQWFTPDACGHAIEGKVVALEDGGDNEEKSEEDGSPTQDLDLPISDRPRRSTVTILLLTGAAVLIIAYLIYAPPPSLQRLISSAMEKVNAKRRRIHFRTGEGSLIKWASEDMGVLDGEEDFINGNGEFDMERGLASEEIPLTPSPKRRGFFGTKYGSA